MFHAPSTHLFSLQFDHMTRANIIQYSFNLIWFQHNDNMQRSWLWLSFFFLSFKTSCEKTTLFHRDLKWSTMSCICWSAPSRFTPQKCFLFIFSLEMSFHFSRLLVISDKHTKMARSYRHKNPSCKVLNRLSVRPTNAGTNKCPGRSYLAFWI